MAKIRLNKFLAERGIASRRKSDDLIRAGRISVNDGVVTDLGATVDPESDRIAYDSVPVDRRIKFFYISMNKPAGVVTTVSDEFSRRTVIDMLPDEFRVVPVGRLDKDSQGLLLLTNDGELCYRLTHPRYKVEKAYAVRLDRPLSQADRQRLLKGVRLHRKLARAVRVGSTKDSREVEIVLHQGIKRQIRLMVAALGYRVVSLCRTRIGPLEIGNLQPGKWRMLARAEVSSLKIQVGLIDGNQE